MYVYVLFCSFFTQSLGVPLLFPSLIMVSIEIFQIEIEKETGRTFMNREARRRKKRERIFFKNSFKKYKTHITQAFTMPMWDTTHNIRIYNVHSGHDTLISFGKKKKKMDQKGVQVLLCHTQGKHGSDSGNKYKLVMISDLLKDSIV